MKRKSRMQHAMTIVLTVCMAAACFAPMALAEDTGGTDSSGYTVQLVPLDSDGNEITGDKTAQYMVGDEFSVALKISGADYAAFELNLTYDSTQLTYVKADAASISSDTAGTGNYSFIAEDSATPGTIKATMIGNTRTAGSTAAIFHFKGLQVGTEPALTIGSALVGAQGSDLGASDTVSSDNLTGCKVKIHGVGVTVSGSVVSYNPQNAVTVTLYKSDDTEHATAIYTGTIAAAESGSGQTTQSFSVEGVEAGTYDIVVTKAAHLTYTVKSVTVGSEALDLTASTNDAVKTITLLAGDINGDALISVDDLNVIWNDANYNKSAENAENKLTDINGDGTVTVDDLNIVWNDSNYNKSAADNCTVSY